MFLQGIDHLLFVLGLLLIVGSRYILFKTITAFTIAHSITLAIAKLTPEALEQSLPEVTNGLGVAFDTTALALGLSIILMFTKFFVERSDVRLLATVEQRATAELVGRFQDTPAEADPNLASVRQMAEHVIASTESLVQRQTELWRSTVDSAHQQWNQWSYSRCRL